MSEKKILLAYDFDHTIIDENSDIYVINLAPDGKLPQSVKDKYKDNCWIGYMRAIFRYLFETGIRPDDIKRNMEELEMTDGMKELINHTKGDKYESIIISDSNTHFIRCVLKNENVDSIFTEVFSNPASFDDDGCLNIEYFHTQDYCSLSNVNLCKGRILQDFIQARQEAGVDFSHVIYIGDGSNDLCPGLTLRSQDYLCPRKGFTLWKKLKKAAASETKDEAIHTLKAKVVEWENGIEIKQLLETL